MQVIVFLLAASPAINRRQWSPVCCELAFILTNSRPTSNSTSAVTCFRAYVHARNRQVKNKLINI